MKTMKKISTLMIALMMGIAIQGFSQARVQVIHNSADLAAKVVDVWLDDQMLIDDFEFRTATPFIDAPAGVEFRVAILPPNSTSPDNPIWQNTYVLEDGRTYVLVANGIVSPSGYTPATPFNIDVFAFGRESSSKPGNADVLVYHGATDAPVVDVVEVALGAGTIVNDLAYSQFQGYLELPAADFSLQIRDMSGTQVVAQYAAPLQSLGLADQAMVVLASGFLNPASNSDGPAFGLFVALTGGGSLVPLPSEEISTARIQVIHNSSDILAKEVDIWVNGQLAIDNFMFRTATPFIDAPANQDVTISVQPANSSSASNPLWSNTFVFQGGERYVLVANGLVNPSGYDPFVPFDIFVYNPAREFAGIQGYTDIVVFHGSTDAPVVDIYEGTTKTVVIDNLEYSEFRGYLEVPAGNYSFEVRDQSGSVTVATFGAPLLDLGMSGKAVSVIASGFFAPENNSDGPSFGLFLASPDGGELIELPLIESPQETARVQVIHNSADAAAETVDVWLDDQLLIDDFMFRTATPFIDAPAGVDFTIAIQPANSTSPENPLWSNVYNLTSGETYILVANGIVSPTGYDPVQPFNLYVFTPAREMATGMMNTDVMVFHGSTDAPVVDVVEVGQGAGTIIDNLAYGDFAGYLELPTADYSLQIRNEAGNTVVAQYAAPLATLGLNGAAISVIASGFLNPSANSNGPAFGLWVALASGGDLVELPVEPISTARVQVIHNSADAAAETVDVWLDDQLLIDDFMFRTATPFIDAPAGVDFTIAIQPANSTSPENPIWSNVYNLMGGEKYILIANGIVSPTGYDPIQPFDIYVTSAAREEATDMMNTDVLVFHGSTDAPTVDVYETGVGAGLIVDDLMYSEFDGYLELPTQDYVLEVRDETGSATVARYDAPLALLGLDGFAITIVASGFLNSGNNSNGPDFGLFVALPSGGDLLGLSIATGFEENTISDASVNVFPNPASNYLNVNYELLAQNEVRMEIYNLLGSKILEQGFGFQSSGIYNQTINISGLTGGMYLLRISAGKTQITEKIKVVN